MPWAWRSPGPSRFNDDPAFLAMLASVVRAADQSADEDAAATGIRA